MVGFVCRLNVGFDLSTEDITLRPPDTSEAYAYCNENFHAYPNGKHPAYALPFGTYHVRVRLRGPTVEQDFWFKLSNPANGKPLGLEPLT